MADDLSSASRAPRGVDLVAGTAGRFVRGQGTPSTATVTATGVIGSAVEVAGHGIARLDLVIAGATGTTPSMTVTVETSFDNGATDAWRSVAAFAAQTAAGTTRTVFAGCDRWIRARASTVSGTTPSFTGVSVSGEMV